MIENGRPCIICTLCNTYVATAKPDADSDIEVEFAFNAAMLIHFHMYHSKLPADQAIFAYGLRP